MNTFYRPAFAGMLVAALRIGSTWAADVPRTADPSPFWIDRPESQLWRDALIRASLQSGIPAGVLAEVIGMESGFRNVKNPTSTAFGFGQQVSANMVMRVCRLDRTRPEDSIMGTALELRAKLDKTGSLAGALRAYGTTAAMPPEREASVLRRFAKLMVPAAKAAAKPPKA